MTKLKLFVWYGFCPDYTSGLAFAVAENESDARDQITKIYGGYSSPYEWGELEIYPLNKKIAAYVCGGS